MSHLRTVALGIKFFTNATANGRPVPDLELCGTRRDRVIAEAEANDCAQQRRETRQEMKLDDCPFDPIPTDVDRTGNADRRGCWHLLGLGTMASAEMADGMNTSWQIHRCLAVPVPVPRQNAIRGRNGPYAPTWRRF